MKSENKSPHYAEVIFEVERDTKEPTRRWATNLDNPIIARPILSGNTVYIAATDDKLYALNTENGKKRTLLTARGAFYGSPLLKEGTLYLGSTDHTFYAVNAENGSVKWKFETGASISAAAGIALDTVCFGSGDKIYGVDTRTGKQNWVKDMPGFFQSEVATDGESFYLGGRGTSIMALDARMGTIRWKLNEPLTVGRRQSSVVVAPVVAGSRVYTTRLDGTVAAFDAKSGRPLWRVKSPLVSLAFGQSAFAVEGINLYIAANGKSAARLYALNTADGSMVWQTPLSQRVIKAGVKLAPDGKSLAVVGVRGSVSVHSTQDGKKLWGYELGPGNVFSTPEYDGQTVYTATMANDVQALNAPGYVPPKKTK